MTLTIHTTLGNIKVTPNFKVTAKIRKKIEQGLKLALEDSKPVENLLEKIKKDIPWADTPRGVLVAYMTSQEWTQEKLAKASGLSQADISKMVNGKRTIGNMVAKKLAKAFGVDYRKLL